MRRKGEEYRRWNSCERKRRYKSQKSADRAIRSIKKRGAIFVNDRPKIYECPHCGGFHIAHKRKKVKGGK